MSQYTLYTVNVTNGSSTVTSTGATQFLAYGAAGNSFKVAGDPVIYQIASVDSNTQFTLSSMFRGVTASGVAYQITRDFTPNFKLAEINMGDADWPTHLTVETIRRIDEILTGAVSGYIVKGAWDAATNTPVIPAASPSNIGWTYRVVTAGDTNIDGIARWYVGDTILSNGSSWFRIASVAAAVLENVTLTTTAALTAQDAATAASNAATSATNSATAALASKTAAASSETNAVNAAAALSSSLAAFNTTFLGRYATDPLTDGYGNPILDGATYVNTITDTIKIYSLEAQVWANYDEAAQAASTSANLAATNASASATYALASKNSAALSEVNADAAALVAATSATTATTKAGEAAASATTATTKAGEAAASATNALEYLNSMREVTSALVDGTGHLKITYSDASVVDAGYVKGAAGIGVSSVVKTSGTGAAGTTDIYTITLTDATTSTFSVYNGIDGADGIGSGDMLKFVYDPNGDGVIEYAQLAGVATDTHTHAGIYEPANDNLQSHVGSTSNPHNVTKTQVGLGSVDNTADIDKPISTAVSTALGNKADLVGGLIPSNQLPSYVDDVLEYVNLAAFPAIGASGVVYVAADTNVTYRWSGSAYVVIGSDLALGETSSTAYRGDRGKTAYDHSQVAHAPSNAEANVQSDWNQATDTADDYIKNKPTLGTMAAQNDVTTDGKQYVRKDQAWAEVVIPEGGISVTVSGLLTLYVTQETTLTITNYDSATTYGVSVVSGSVSRTGDTITYTAGNIAGTDTLTITAGAATRAVTITVNAAGIVTPTNSTPANGATDQSGPTLALSASAFSWTGLEDTHASSDWESATDSGFMTIVDSSYTDTTNKTSWTADVSTSQTYYWRVKYRGASGRESAWSTATSFTTKANFGGLIGTAGAQGFGVGVYNDTLPSGFSAMTGTTDPASDNYGNYQYTDGSVMCFVPKFYYRIGSTSSPRYATYGLNAVDIAGINTYATEAAANADGYVLHRAFTDGGSVKSGFFIDKYLCSKNGTTSGKSVKNGVPISLATSTLYTNSNGMAGGACTGILADAVVLSRARGTGFNTASIFMYSALALLSLAHGQAATAATYCAWYDAAGTTNFPKGCNNGSLADHLDATVTFTTAGDSGTSAKPLTGSASNLAKTAHNGQNSGVVDLNGAMYQVMLGLTDFGTSAIDTTQHTNGNVYLLKTSVALSSLTAGWDGATDAWGNTTSLATKYDAVTGLLPWGATTGWLYMGNGTNRVLDPATSGAGYQRTSCGIPQDTNVLSAGGTNLYGNDGQYQYNRANLFPLASGFWSNAATAGLFYRYWSFSRSNDNGSYGFRASAYGA